MIEDLFAPGRKHTAEEQKRLELSRVDVDGSDPGRGPIDLASGKVTIRRPESDPAAPDARPDRAQTHDQAQGPGTSAGTPA
ncbi:DUF6191 domain-containing protein [Streptomyces tremellae]